jgi:[acyl-carrier-protein] S-malonyltransferase
MMLALLFAGQGSQVVGMGAQLAASCAGCRATFRAADRALGFPLSRIMLAGPEEELRRTAIAQPALLTIAVAQAQHLAARGIVPRALVGHSLGQYAALVMAGALDFENAVRLVAARGRLMQQTVPEGDGAMVAIVGLERAAVYASCEAARSLGVVDVACHNGPGQTVISGARAAVDATCERCEQKGAGVVPLAVTVPFHCALLAPMVQPFAPLVDAAAITDPVLPVIDNVTAQPLRDAAAVRRSLVEQITTPVLFEESVRTVADAGTRHFIQCGPGDSLLRFAKRVVPDAACETFEQAEMRATRRETTKV